MRLGNNTSSLTFRQAIVVEYGKNSSHGCACSRDFDAAMAAVQAGKIQRKGTKPYEVPGSSNTKFIIANGEHKTMIEEAAANLKIASRKSDEVSWRDVKKPKKNTRNNRHKNEIAVRKAHIKAGIRLEKAHEAYRSVIRQIMNSGIETVTYNDLINPPKATETIILKAPPKSTTTERGIKGLLTRLLRR